jgi:hypothetical protein
LQFSCLDYKSLVARLRHPDLPMPATATLLQLYAQLHAVPGSAIEQYIDHPTVAGDEVISSVHKKQYSM